MRLSLKGTRRREATESSTRSDAVRVRYGAHDVYINACSNSHSSKIRSRNKFIGGSVCVGGAGATSV